MRGVSKQRADLHPALPLLSLLPIQEHRRSALLHRCEECHQGQAQKDESQHISAVALAAIWQQSTSVHQVEPQQDGSALHPVCVQTSVMYGL